MSVFFCPYKSVVTKPIPYEVNWGGREKSASWDSNSERNSANAIGADRTNKLLRASKYTNCDWSSYMSARKPFLNDIPSRSQHNSIAVARCAVVASLL